MPRINFTVKLGGGQVRRALYDFAEVRHQIRVGLHKYLMNSSSRFQKSIDGFFLPDIMRPLLLLQQEVEGSKGCKK